MVLKKISLLLFCFGLLNCSAQKKQYSKFASITYTAQSRGFSESIKVMDQILYFKENGTEKEVVITFTNAEFLAWKKELNALNVTKIPNLKAPTKKRLFDGAAHATFSVEMKNNKIYTSQFDHGKPPVALQSSINFLYQITQKHKNEHH